MYIAQLFFHLGLLLAELLDGLQLHLNHAEITGSLLEQFFQLINLLHVLCSLQQPINQNK